MVLILFILFLFDLSLKKKMSCVFFSKVTFSKSTVCTGRPCDFGYLLLRKSTTLSFMFAIQLGSGGVHHRLPNNELHGKTNSDDNNTQTSVQPGRLLQYILPSLSRSSVRNKFKIEKKKYYLRQKKGATEMDHDAQRRSAYLGTLPGLVRVSIFILKDIKS